MGTKNNEQITLENGGKLDQSKPSPQKIKLIKTREQTELIGQIGFYIFLALLVTGFCLIFGGLLLIVPNLLPLGKMATLPLNIGQQLSSFFVLGCGVLFYIVFMQTAGTKGTASVGATLDVFGIGWKLTAIAALIGSMLGRIGYKRHKNDLLLNQLRLQLRRYPGR